MFFFPLIRFQAQWIFHGQFGICIESLQIFMLSLNYSLLYILFEYFSVYAEDDHLKSMPTLGWNSKNKDCEFDDIR